MNVSIRRRCAPLGTRVEIKNVNSIRFIGQAIEIEALRQAKLLEAGESILQENRCMILAKGKPGPCDQKRMRRIIAISQTQICYLSS